MLNADLEPGEGGLEGVCEILRIRRYVVEQADGRRRFRALPPPVPFALPRFSPTPTSLHDRPEVMHFAVLPGELRIGPVGPGAEVSAVDHKPLLAALHGEDEPGDRSIWHGFKGASDPAFEGVDAAGDIDVDDAVKRYDQIWQFVV